MASDLHQRQEGTTYRIPLRLKAGRASAGLGSSGNATYTVYWTSSSLAAFQMNYTNTETLRSHISSSPQSVGLEANLASPPWQYVKWMRVRTAPPENLTGVPTMPAVSFGNRE